MDTPKSRPSRTVRRSRTPGRPSSNPRNSPGQGRSSAKDFLGSLKIWPKLLLITLAFLVPFVVVTGRLIYTQNQTIDFSLKETYGVKYLRPTKRLLVALEQHLVVSDQVLRGDVQAAARQVEAAAQVDSALRSVVSIDRRYGAEFGTREQVQAIAAAWEGIQVEAAAGESRQNAFRHLDLLRVDIPQLFGDVANASNLAFDPEQTSSLITSLAVTRLLELESTVNTLLDRTNSVLYRNEITEPERSFINQQLGFATRSLRDIEQNVTYAVETDSGLEEALAAPTARAAQSIDTYITGIKQVILQAAELPGPRALNGDATSALADLAALHNVSFNVLNERLENRVANLRRAQLLGMVFIALAISLAYVLFALIATRISGPINQLFNASTRLSQGDLSARANVSSTDELGVLAGTFNNSVRQLQLKAQADAEILERNRELQGNIGSFLNVAMDIAGGDFTQRGQVSEDVLGNVVDAINLMVEEISLVLTEFSETANSVRSGSGELLLTTEAIAAGSQQQTVEAQRARNQVVQITGSIQQMARDAEASARATQQALTASEQGQQAMDDTLGGMQNIRREVQGISKRVKTLGERSLEISEIVETISRISSQTNLLAVNAAIEAAGAGRAGQRFSVIADEVGRLAEDTSLATGRVDELIKGIQEEVQEVNLGVEGGTREVEAGYRVATEAGERLKEVAEVVRQAVTFAQSISQATETQVVNVTEVGNSVQSMATLSESSRDRVVRGREAAENLQDLAERLTESLVRFRLA